ncbi:DUF732 domain-containing protein [Mycobacterium asiaticum]|uniref:DUF732 domain-containing protein n=1 Tax=Mycobacterium asiaticum TaxID=1790 RepID=UPI000A09850A|nr:hypothetical protein BST16_13540 [Mycobacterium asiaticum DSM 44297]
MSPSRRGASKVCGFVSRGASRLQLSNDIRDNNPGLTSSGAAQSATISAKSYCSVRISRNRLLRDH